MESHKPILSTNELKELCRKVTKENKTPLVQAQAAIKEITRLRAEIVDTEIHKSEWQCLKDNQVYMNIAESYLEKRAQIRKERQEAKKRLERFS